MYFQQRYSISSMDLDCFNCCQASAVLGYLQDAAGLAAAQFGASNHEMARKHGHCWMVVRTAFSLDRPLRWGDALTVKTWHRGGDKPLMYRDFELSVEDKVVGQATSIWVLVDLATHTMTRPNAFPEFPGTDGGELIRDTKLLRLRLPQGMEPAETRTFHYSDTDGNGHVNNTRYADFLCDALELHTATPGSFVKALHIDYLQECKAGESVTLLGRQTDDGYYAQGVDSQGTARFSGLVRLGKGI